MGVSGRSLRLRFRQIARSINRLTSSMTVAGRISPKTSPWALLTLSQSSMLVRDAGFDDIVEAGSSFGQDIFDCLKNADGLFVGVAAGNLDARSDTDGAGISDQGFPF